MAARKTTLMLDEQMLSTFKARAAQSGRSLSSLIEEAMRSFDRRHESQPRPKRWTLPVGSAGAYLGSANRESNAELLDATEKPYPGANVP